jgi:hypothetical protein
MSRKERVRSAIEHREPDRVPVAEWIVDYEITVQTPLANILAMLEAAGRHPQPAPAPIPNN